jgi:5'-nucleotidase
VHQRRRHQRAGPESLERIARALSDDVWIVAPETDQSGVSHIALAQRSPAPARGRRAALRREGHADDCVIMAIRHVMRDAPPDLILSGVNRGQNVAEDVSYSGTIAAAIEGTMLGFRPSR